jgi:hypothetical protein
MADEDAAPLSGLRSNYSATSLVQNTHAYSRDGRVRAPAGACA